MTSYKNHINELLLENIYQHNATFEKYNLPIMMDYMDMCPGCGDINVCEIIYKSQHVNYCGAECSNPRTYFTFVATGRHDEQNDGIYRCKLIGDTTKHLLHCLDQNDNEIKRYRSKTFVTFDKYKCNNAKRTAFKRRYLRYDTQYKKWFYYDDSMCEYHSLYLSLFTTVYKPTKIHKRIIKIK